MHTPAQDVVRISLVFCSGVKYQNKSFISSSTANLLSEGCADRTSHQMAELLDFYGIYYDVSVDRDYTVITMCTLGKFIDKTLEILSDIILKPLFLKDECEIYTQKRKSELKIEREKIDVRSREELARTIFGQSHHYGIFSDADDYDNVTSEDLRAFYNRFYTRANLFAVVSGNISSQLLDGVKHIVDALPEGVSERVISAAPTAAVQIKRVSCGVAVAVQSAVNIGRVLFARTHPDFIAMQVTATLLGGYFSSRLVKNLREDHGFTYGIYAAVVNMQDSGYFAISSELKSECTDDAVEEIFREIELLREVEPSHEELEMVKRVITGEMLRILDGPFGIADVTIENIQNGVTNRATEEMIEKIDAVTPADVRDMARKYLQREDLSVVIYS
ncbi:MAG: pitrilysin family protein [Rikenellaceae bacterium]